MLIMQQLFPEIIDLIVRRLVPVEIQLFKSTCTKYHNQFVGMSANMSYIKYGVIYKCPNIVLEYTRLSNNIFMAVVVFDDICDWDIAEEYYDEFGKHIIFGRDYDKNILKVKSLSLLYKMTNTALYLGQRKLVIKCIKKCISKRLDNKTKCIAEACIHYDNIKKRYTITEEVLNIVYRDKPQMMIRALISYVKNNRYCELPSDFNIIDDDTIMLNLDYILNGMQHIDFMIMSGLNVRDIRHIIINNLVHSGMIKYLCNCKYESIKNVIDLIITREYVHINTVEEMLYFDPQVKYNILRRYSITNDLIASLLWLPDKEYNMIDYNLTMNSIWIMPSHRLIPDILNRSDNLHDVLMTMNKKHIRSLIRNIRISKLSDDVLAILVNRCGNEIKKYMK